MKFTIRDRIDSATAYHLSNAVGSSTELLVVMAVEAGGCVVEREGRRWFCAPCSYCGNWFRLKFLNRDHVVPRSAGGVNHPSNIVLSCILCNDSRHSKYMGEYLRRGELPLLIKQFQSFII